VGEEPDFLVHILTGCDLFHNLPSQAKQESHG